MTVPTLVMLPGLGSDAAIWRRTIAALAGEVSCLVGDTLSDDTLPKMASRILGQAPPTFALVGISMGGMAALELLRVAPPGRVTHLALVDTNARPDSVGRKAYRHLTNLAVGMISDFRHPAERSLGSLVHPATSEDVRLELVEMAVRVGARIYVRQNRAVSARSDLRKVLPSIDVPTSVVVGADDRMTPPGLSREIHSLTPRSTLHVIPECGHLPPIEKPDAMAAVLRELLLRR